MGPNFQDKGPVQLRVGHKHLCGLTYLETNPIRVKGQRIFFPSLLQKQCLQEWGVGGIRSCVSTVPSRGSLSSKLWHQLSSRSPQVWFPPGRLRADGLDDSEGGGRRELREGASRRKSKKKLFKSVSFPAVNTPRSPGEDSFVAKWPKIASHILMAVPPPFL